MLDVIDLNLVFSDHLVPETVVHHLNLHMDEGIWWAWWENPVPENP